MFQPPSLWYVVIAAKLTETGNVQTHMETHTHMHTHMRMYTHAHIPTDMHTHTHIFICQHTDVPKARSMPRGTLTHKCTCPQMNAHSI